MKLDAKNVSVSIAGKPIVRNLSIEVPDRKFSALLGANGSGKTTLLRSIYRTQKMDSGIVRLDDEDITHFSGKKLARNMAVMGQFNQINIYNKNAGVSRRKRNLYEKENPECCCRGTGSRHAGHWLQSDCIFRGIVRCCLLRDCFVLSLIHI